MLKYIVSLYSLVNANVLDDYVAKDEEVYNWYQETNGTFKTPWGNTAHILNVTSQTWLDESKARGPRGAVWDHRIAVIVPKNLKVTNISSVWLTGNCNDGSHEKELSNKDGDLLLMDELAHNTKSVTVVVKQIPNCHLHFPSDPNDVARSEDKMIAWTWREYIDDPEHNPEWLARLPMVKGAFQTMRAAQEFLAQENIAQIEGWTVSGGSKRGWTTWMVGATECESCAAKIIAIAPVVPIVPDIHKDVHRMW